MRTEKAKATNGPKRHDFRIVMSLTTLYSACMKNATELLAEAELLFSHGHIPRAFALAYTGWEEVGKAQLVGDYSSRMISDEEFQAAFRDHHLKGAYNWRHFVLNPNNTTEGTIEYDRNRVNPHFAKRQAAFYVEKDAEMKPQCPGEAVAAEEAEAVISALKKEINQINKFDYINERIGSASFLK